jgi:hypothetical protein
MKVKMLTLSAGPDGARQPGRIYPVSAEEGKALVDGGYAVEVKSTDAANAEPSTSSAPRTADKPQGRRASKKDAAEESTEEEPTE